MLTKENAKDMSKDQINESIDSIEKKIEDHLRFLQSNQMKIYREPAKYEDEMEGIMKDLKEMQGDLGILRSMKKSLVLFERIDGCRKRIECANHIINSSFYKYWQKVAPFREFKKEVDKMRCDDEDSIDHTLYKALLIVSEIYESMETTQEHVTLICKRARKNAPGDHWFKEACRLKDIIQKSIEEVSFTGTLTIDNEYITHTIYEVMIYDFSVMIAKLDRYIIPKMIKDRKGLK